MLVQDISQSHIPKIPRCSGKSYVVLLNHVFRASMQRFVSKSLALSNSKSITSNHRQFHNGVEKTSVILVHFEKPLSPAYLCCSFTHFCNLMKNCCEVFFTPSLKRAPFEFPSASHHTNGKSGINCWFSQLKPSNNNFILMTFHEWTMRESGLIYRTRNLWGKNRFIFSSQPQIIPISSPPSQQSSALEMQFWWGA